MRILFVGKFPPIQGGVSREGLLAVQQLANEGHSVDVITNASKAESGSRQILLDEDHDFLTFPASSDKITVHNVEFVGEGYVPYAPPYVTQLFGLGTHVIESGQKPDIIIGFYFEPFGVAASMLGKTFNIPVFLRHAGSDLFMLSQYTNLGRSYRHLFSNAIGIYSSSDHSLVKDLLAKIDLGSKRVRGLRRQRLEDNFLNEARPLNVMRISSFMEKYVKGYRFPEKTEAKVVKENKKHFNPSVPVIGVYGKVAPTSKGSLNIVDALSKLAREGAQFQFLTMSTGRPAFVQQFYEAILNEPELAKRTWFLPPVTIWQVPKFLTICDIAFNLENDFFIPFHTPRILREMIAKRCCPVLSQDMVSVSNLENNIIHGKNAMIIENKMNPNQISAAVKTLLDDKDMRVEMAAHAGMLSKMIEDQLHPLNPFAEQILRASNGELEYRLEEKAS